MIFFIPQMSPMMWLILSIFNMFNMFLVMIYLNSMPINLWDNEELDKSLLKMKWDWMW